MKVKVLPDPLILAAVMVAFIWIAPTPTQAQIANDRVQVSALPDLPDEIGMAGPIVGVHDDVLIVAGGANFAKPDAPNLWEANKKYHNRGWVLEKTEVEQGSEYQWDQSEPISSFRLSQSVGYSAVVSTKFGVLVAGGQNEYGLSNRAFLLAITATDGGYELKELDGEVPDLPQACTGGAAAIVGDHVYVVAGQVVGEGGELRASRLIWRLPLSRLDQGNQSKSNEAAGDMAWETVPAWPVEGPPRMFPMVASQHDGFTQRLFVMGGRYFPENTDKSDANNLKFLADCWSFDPDNKTNPWKRIADCPTALSAGTAVDFGPAHIIIPAYATGDVLKQSLDAGIAMKDFDHPGFPNEILSYHSVTNTWTTIGTMPTGQVTTPAVRWDKEIFIVSGEVRPRVRTNKAWRISIPEEQTQFGWLNMSVVAIYLLAMLAIGVWFMLRNKSTDDYFRGGKNIPWWAAGCSIFATMLSSITYMAVPAKAFAQDWVYAVGNFMILAVAPIAIYIALPFFRRIDATSAYEYLELRFSRTLRWIGSASFSLFHIFRMGVVLALAALALSSITPLGTGQCVIVMGVLSIVYCTLGGIEAVIWTDTIQTFILLGGAVLCIAFAWLGADAGSAQTAIDAGKFHAINMDFGPASFTTMAIWVVILGGLGQNVASYTADQTVVQRYMTTPDQKLAARSIWLNGLMAVPAAVVFFGMGTAFWMFYQSHPEKLDPTMSSDRIMPLFISQELPIGLAGLVVAGIFAAAQSTVSTSMNSGATTVVTDFLRPLKICKSETAFLWSARFVTLLMGVAGMCAGLLFVDPSIKSLFDQFIALLGMFLGVLAGLFALGVTTRRANATGSLIGACCSIALMTTIVLAHKHASLLGIDFRSIYDAIHFPLYRINGYLYAFVGIATCYVIGYLASLAVSKGTNGNTLSGLTWYKIDRVENE